MDNHQQISNESLSLQTPILLIVSTFSILTRELMGHNDNMLQLCCILRHNFSKLLR